MSSPGSGTCIRLAPPIAGCGTSPSPPISFDVSTITTRLCSSSASTRAISRMTVVLPTPGRPRNRIELGTSRMSRMSEMWPVTALPTRQVRPMTAPRRLRIAEMRWSVPWTPARLSPPNSPTARSAAARSSAVTSASRRNSRPAFAAAGEGEEEEESEEEAELLELDGGACLPSSSSSAPLPRKRASGRRPRSSTTSSSDARRGWLATVARMSSGRASSNGSRSSRTVTEPSSSCRTSGERGRFIFFG